MYKLNEQSITRLSDNASIPMAEGNTDYAEYLEWLSEGNTPQPQFTQDEIDANAQAVINQEAKEYLSTTDWMLWRELDGGVGMTAEVKQLRADARARVV